MSEIIATENIYITPRGKELSYKALKESEKLPPEDIF